MTLMCGQKFISQIVTETKRIYDAKSESNKKNEIEFKLPFKKSDIIE